MCVASVGGGRGSILGAAGGGFLGRFQALYREALLLHWPQARLVTPAGDAASGALAIARERLERTGGR